MFPLRIGHFRSRLNDNLIGRLSSSSFFFNFTQLQVWVDGRVLQIRTTATRSNERPSLIIFHFTRMLPGALQGGSSMATYLVYTQWTEQGIRNIKESPKR